MQPRHPTHPAEAKSVKLPGAHECAPYGVEEITVPIPALRNTLRRYQRTDFLRQAPNAATPVSTRPARTRPRSKASAPGMARSTGMDAVFLCDWAGLCGPEHRTPQRRHLTRPAEAKSVKLPGAHECAPYGVAEITVPIPALRNTLRRYQRADFLKQAPNAATPVSTRPARTRPRSKASAPGMARSAGMDAVFLCDRAGLCGPEHRTPQRRHPTLVSETTRCA